MRKAGRFLVAVLAGALAVPGALGCSGSALGNSAGDDDDVVNGGEDGGTVVPPTVTCACEGCSYASIGISAQTPFDIIADESEFVGIDDEGALVADKRNSSYNQFLWVADTDLPGVVKIDLTTFEIVGRYRTPGRSTSRTTVNILGHAFVGSRMDGDEGKTGVTKILPDGAGCPDTNGDGAVTTSLGRNDVLPWGEDDCVAWHVEAEGDIRGLAAQDVRGEEPEDVCVAEDDVGVVVPDEHYVWIGGLHGKIYKLDAETGEILLKVNAPAPVYGMALDADGKLWTGQRLAFLDTTRCIDEATCNDAPTCEETCHNGAECTYDCADAVKGIINWIYGYGITVDCKNRIWMSDGNTTRYDPDARPTERMTIGPRSGSGGIAADGNGWIWAANGATTVRLDAETLESIEIASPNKGVAIDSLGRVITIENRGVHLIEPGETLDDYQLSNDVTTLEGFAYAYSDMTGVQTRLAASGPGRYRHRFEGCTWEERTDWRALGWNIDAPDDTWVQFFARSANTPAQLAEQPWRPVVSCLRHTGCTDAAPIHEQWGNLLEVEVRLTANPEAEDDKGCSYRPGSSARVRRFDVGYVCAESPVD